MDENELIYKRWIEEVWNQKKPEVIDELFDKDGIAFYPYFLKSEEPLRGIEENKEFYHRIQREFDDLLVETIDLAVMEDKIIAVCLISSVSVNENGESQRSAVKSLCQFKIEAGKIIEIWNNVDLDEQSSKIPLLEV